MLCTYTACQDPCKNNLCGGNGTCQEEICICNSGYELDEEGACTIVSRTQFLGVYDALETCSQTTENHYIDIIEHSSVDKIIIKNLYNHPNNEIIAQVEEDTFSFSEQITADNFVVTGRGWIADTDSLVYIQYKLSNFQSLKDSCMVSLSPK
ncbi:MAG: hypothetical protein GY810_15240 [Aureispira sp.]|nr:hypothetical protein [Aureispira sp.]